MFHSQFVPMLPQINPSLLAKKDRGRGADLDKAPLEYGAAAVPDRIEVCTVTSRSSHFNCPHALQTLTSACCHERHPQRVGSLSVQADMVWGAA